MQLSPCDKKLVDIYFVGIFKQGNCQNFYSPVGHNQPTKYIIKDSSFTKFLVCSYATHSSKLKLFSLQRDKCKIKGHFNIVGESTRKWPIKHVQDEEVWHSLASLGRVSQLPSRRFHWRSASLLHQSPCCCDRCCKGWAAWTPAHTQIHWGSAQNHISYFTTDTHIGDTAFFTVVKAK